MNDPFINNQKLVIALCRKPLSADEDEFDNMKGKDSMEEPINNTGFIEYTRHNMQQYYHVEQVLSMIDVSNEGNRNQNGANGSNQNNSNNIDSHQSGDSSLFHNELHQINHISQLFVGLNVYSLLFF